MIYGCLNVLGLLVNHLQVAVVEADLASDNSPHCLGKLLRPGQVNKLGSKAVGDPYAVEGTESLFMGTGGEAQSRQSAFLVKEKEKQLQLRRGPCISWGTVPVCPGRPTGRKGREREPSSDRHGREPPGAAGASGPLSSEGALTSSPEDWLSTIST